RSSNHRRHAMATANCAAELSSQGPAKPKPDKSQKTLPTWRVAFGKQIEILRAYAAVCASGPRAVTNNEIAKLVDLRRDTVATANPFFFSIGLLEKTEDGNIPCGEVLSLSRAYEWKPETAGHKLAPVFQKAWPAQAVLPRLQLRNLAENELIEELGDA